MKTRLLLFSVMSIFSLSAQRFSHGLGVNYMQANGTYGNYDAASLLYNPKLLFQCPKSKLIFGLSAPVSYGMVTSSARSGHNNILELPLNIEVNINQKNQSKNPYTNNGVLVGGGVSRVMRSGEMSGGTTYMNSYIGFRASPLGHPVEVKFSYSAKANGSGVQCPFAMMKDLDYSSNRIGLAVSYIFR